MLNVVSLFDGIGGFPLAFERAGARVVATVEIDKPAAAIGARHFPHARQFDDVTKVSGDELRAAGFIPDRGIVTAGWPCQDFSVAGRRAGLDGTRSGLWWEVVRILAELRPRWFLGENVPGLLSSVCQCPGDESCIVNGRSDDCGDWKAVKPGVDVSSGRFRTVKRSRQVWVAHVIHGVVGGCCIGGCMETHGGAMGAVLGSLAELGYGVAYRVLDAQYFGVPQRRERVFIVGHLGEPFTAPAAVLLESESGAGDSPQSRKTQAPVTASVAAGVGGVGRDLAPALVARYAKGTDSDATDALIIDRHTHTHTTISTLQGGGRRGYRIDAESAAGGHLIVSRGGGRVDK